MVALGDWQFSRWSVLFARQTNMHVNGRLHTLILHLFSQEENKTQAFNLAVITMTEHLCCAQVTKIQ